MLIRIRKLAYLLSVLGSGSPPQNIIEINTGYTAITSDDVIVGTGTFTITLPPVVKAFKMVIIKSVSAGGGTITVDADGTETIEGALTQTLTPGAGFFLAPTSTGWGIVG